MPTSWPGVRDGGRIDERLEAGELDLGEAQFEFFWTCAARPGQGRRRVERRRISLSGRRRRLLARCREQGRIIADSTPGPALPTHAASRPASGALPRRRGRPTMAPSPAPARASSTGVSTRQRSFAYGQRGWNAQPGGGSSGLGTSPATAVRGLPVIARSGTASSSMRVYGCCGAANSSRVGASSTMRPEVHDADAIGDVMHHREVVRDEEIGEAELALQVAHQVQHLRLHRHVERGRRLVADEERRVGRQRARDRDALPLAAGELVRIFARRRRRQGRPASSSAATRVVDLARRLPRAVRADRLGDDVRHAPARIEARVRILEDHLHAVRAQRCALGGRATVACAGRRTRIAPARRRVQARRSAARPSTCRSPIRRPAPASRPWRSPG